MERKREEREHVRALQLLRERIPCGEYRTPIRGIIRNCIGVARVFVIRNPDKIRLQYESDRCIGIVVHGERGHPIRIGVDCDYTVKVRNDGVGRAIFFTNLNE